jgi:hypothetical protein
MGTNPKGCLLGGMGGRSLVVLKARRWDLKKNSRNYSFGGVGWGVWRKRKGVFFFGSFFLL